MRLFVLVLLGSSAAYAAPNLELSYKVDGTVTARQAVPASESTAVAKTKTIYLNRHGALLKPGGNNSRADTSSLIGKMSQVDGWSVSDSDWAETVACMREIWAPFDVVITETDPDTIPHIEAMFGGSPAQIGMPNNIGGVAPMTLNCGVVENAIVFTFPINLNNNPRRVCEVMSQEIGHAYGLDHELEASDPMTYLSFSGDQSFQDKTVACGEYQPRPCGIAGNMCRPSQNTYQLLLSRLGAGGSDSAPPALEVLSPADQDSVLPGFSVIVDVADDAGVVSLGLFLDGVRVDELTAPPWEFATDPGLAHGQHSLIIEAVDGHSNTALADLVVMVDPNASEESEGMDKLLPGCSSGGAPGFGLSGVLGLFALRRRRSRK